MAIEVVMPKLGWTMEEGILVEWLKQNGDAVQPGDILFTVESDKALNEVESFETGILRIPPDSDAVGKSLPVGALLAYIVQPDEAPPFETASNMPVGARHASSAPVPFIPAPLEPASARPDATVAPSDLPTISPRARRIATELGVNWAALNGSGRTGRIVERDVRAAALATSQEPHPPTPSAYRDSKGVRSALTEMPVAQTRQTSIEGIAVRTQPSTTTNLTTEADATDLVQLHHRIQTAWRNGRQPAPTFDDLLAKLVTEALRETPRLHAHLEDGTFSIMNLGMYEIDAFTPAMSASQSAILGIGRVVAKQIVIDAEKGRVAIRQMMFLSLTCYSQIIDVESAARFLQIVNQYVEQPVLWLVNLP
jgi:pyruvate dehydrogenase E2 component (dihydrolipoamide acetyltransferase)